MTLRAIPQLLRRLFVRAALALLALLPSGTSLAAQAAPPTPSTDIPLYAGMVRLAADERVLAIVGNRRFVLPHDAAPFVAAADDTGQATLMIRASGRFSGTRCAGSEVFGLGYSLVTDLLPMPRSAPRGFPALLLM